MRGNYYQPQPDDVLCEWVDPDDADKCELNLSHPNRVSREYKGQSFCTTHYCEMKSLHGEEEPDEHIDDDDYKWVTPSAGTRIITFLGNLDEDRFPCPACGAYDWDYTGAYHSTDFGPRPAFIYHRGDWNDEPMCILTEVDTKILKVIEAGNSRTIEVLVKTSNPVGWFRGLMVAWERQNAAYIAATTEHIEEDN